MKEILYIEDDIEIGSIVKEDLEQRGYLVRWLTSGEGMEEAFGDTDLVILDVMLPGLDGFTVGRRLKSSHPEIPILMLSARTAVDDKLQGLQFADDYVTKPFHPEELVDSQTASNFHVFIGTSKLNFDKRTDVRGCIGRILSRRG